MRHLIIVVAFLFAARITTAQEIDSTKIFFDSIESTLNYKTGKIELNNGIGSVDVPKGFRFLDAEQAEFVLHDLWGNPSDPTTLGLIVPEQYGVMDDNSWAFIVSYEEMGFVKDEDAGDIDYEELLEEMKEDMVAGNEEREKEGYGAITLVGWASKPFYDEDKKTLHWAKELKFGESEENTLNYNIRILGRKGVVILNAVSAMKQFPEVQPHIQPMLSSFGYADGSQYDDFNPEVDEVAAWTIGGLVAGKVLAKVGFFAIILKNIKLIGLGIVAAATGLWKWFKRKTEPPTVREFPDATNTGDKS
jgi:uncharacterized membrane-anchored protein